MKSAYVVYLTNKFGTVGKSEVFKSFWFAQLYAYYKSKDGWNVRIKKEYAEYDD